ncbi:helix-turn-helix transcriptional regulator [Kutzneria chonburiensis]|uniref:LuxR C-terminal-related transcriptional regulator n=1 Tax=Kutzneria chonburiensis TaxID=1483604 RepID=A0ABV6N5N6_9PSEU|nr:helix-turn-helix transcriptional regulator [Kutzneria chonburiensis]
MSGLGLDPVAETVYLTALTRVRWRLADLARHVDVASRPDDRPHTNSAPGDGVDRLCPDGPTVAGQPRPDARSAEAADQVRLDDGAGAPGDSRSDRCLPASADQVCPSDRAGVLGRSRPDGCLLPSSGQARSGGRVVAGAEQLGSGGAGEQSRPDGWSGEAAELVRADEAAARRRSRPDGRLLASADRARFDDRFVAAVDRLRTDGLLVASAEESGAVRAVDPALGLPALAASRVWGLSAGDSRPQALAIAQVIARHEPSAADRLHGLDEMNSFAEHLVANARREVVILSGQHRTGSFEFAVPVAEAVLRRGAEFRLLWRSELIRTPTVAAHATWLRSRGAAPRIVQTLPTSMLLVDRSVAVVITGDDAVVNRAASAVAPLCMLADQLWANSSPGPRRQHTADQTPRHHKVLRLLADGLTDDAIARQVGVSVRTVRNDMAAAMLSLDARSRFQAGVRAAQLGLL